MIRTFITGAAGFTGRHLCQTLAHRGHLVHGLVHAQPDQAIQGVAVIHEADLADLEAMRQIVADVQPDNVVHLAAVAFVAHGDIEALYRSNVVGTRQLLEALCDQPSRPSSVLLASSANIYGNSRAGVLDESLPPSPANDYGISKAASELLGRLYGERLPIIIARPFNYTGRGQDENFIIPKILSHAIQRRSVIELGNLDVSRDFSDVRTVVDAYARLLSEPKAIGGTFNICSGRAVSLDEIIGLVQKITSHSFEVLVNQEFVRENEVQSLCGSAKRVESMIGPLQRISLEETITWMADELSEE
jgi:nucleoside-diphosphate-sugar epimerase